MLQYYNELYNVDREVIQDRIKKKFNNYFLQFLVGFHCAADCKISTPYITAAYGDDEQWTSGSCIHREAAIPVDHQTCHTILRFAEGHPRPGFVGTVPVVLCHFLRHVLDIVPK